MSVFTRTLHILLIVLAIVACKPDPVPGPGPEPPTTGPVLVTSVQLSSSSLEMQVGESSTLTVSIKPANADNKTVEWSSSDPAVASVQNGVIKALAIGSATITVKTQDGGKTAVCKVKVVPPKVTDVTLDRTNVSIHVNETVTLVATVKPDDAADKTVTWLSSNSSVAKVEGGLVTALGVGETTITAKAGDKSATCAVTVEPIHVTGISLDKTSLNLSVGEKYTLVATVSPSDATDKSVEWETSDKNVATVAGGIVTAKKNGKCSISAKTVDGAFQAMCAITVSADGLNPGIGDWGEGDNHGGDAE